MSFNNCRWDEKKVHQTTQQSLLDCGILAWTKELREREIASMSG
jgi:hypothetical protein